MKDTLNEWGKPYGLSSSEGSISDVSNIVSALNINGINLFAGYYNAHSGNEYTSMKDLAKSYKFQLELLPLLHNYFTAKPDAIEFTDTAKTYRSYGGYGMQAYDGNWDWHYTGGKVATRAVTTYPNASDLELPELKDEFLDVVDDMDLLDQTYKIYDDVMDVEMTLSKSKKSLILAQAWYLIPDALNRLAYYFTVEQGIGGDACISIKEIRDYEHKAMTGGTDYDSIGGDF
tara:strand:- start:1402 stop:2094 length:693 start_codon:yes stop_codon:yes gene_type:complete